MHITAFPIIAGTRARMSSDPFRASVMVNGLAVASRDLLLVLGGRVGDVPSFSHAQISMPFEVARSLLLVNASL